MRFQDIKPMTLDATYKVNVAWTSIERTLKEYDADYGLNLNPDFQRAHVWGEEKQKRYVEFILRRGKGSKEIRFNSAGWMSCKVESPVVLVDGKQRLEAVRKFLRNDLVIFGKWRYSDFTDKPNIVHCDFEFMVNSLETEKEVLQWYIDLNDGGVAHTEEEIKKVKIMLERCT